MSKKDEILIIGNGRSVLDFSFGEEINKFPVVGRINNYATKKFDNYVGQKTDIWFNGANQNLKKRNRIPSEVVILIPPEILQRKGEAIYHRIFKRLKLSNEEYSLVSIETMRQYEKQLGVIRPTTGTSSILWALGNYKKVIIHGFDFFIDSKTHYNENIIIKWLIDWGINKKAGKHNMIAEKQYIDKLIRENKVTPLKENLKQ